MSGTEFDKALLDSEIRVHTFARYLVSGVLLRDAQNPELRDILTNAAPSVEENLNAVKAIRANIK